MSKRPVLVEFDTTVEAARRVCEQQAVHHLLVIDDGDLVGEICLCDLEDPPASVSIAGIVRSPFAYVRTDTTLADAARTMLDCNLGCLPVLGHDGGLSGVVTRRDLRRAGVLPGARGIDCCGGCGETHGLGRVEHGGDVVFCRSCIERAGPPRDGARVTTLGGSG
jgi:CBS-domain-containing membrane protein